MLHPELNRDVWHFIILSPDMLNRLWMDGWKQKECLKSHWQGSDDGVGAPEADSAGELFQQASDGARGAGRRGLEAHSGAVGCQEDFPHRLQTGLTLRGEGTPGEERGGKDRKQEGLR